jgi:hypothetical protein
VTIESSKIFCLSHIIRGDYRGRHKNVKDPMLLSREIKKRKYATSGFYASPFILR